MVKDTTFYDRLEVTPTTSIEDIKKKGKKLLIKWHPDKNPNNVAEATKISRNSRSFICFR